MLWVPRPPNSVSYACLNSTQEYRVSSPSKDQKRAAAEISLNYNRDAGHQCYQQFYQLQQDASNSRAASSANGCNTISLSRDAKKSRDGAKTDKATIAERPKIARIRLVRQSMSYSTVYIVLIFLYFPHIPTAIELGLIWETPRFTVPPAVTLLNCMTIKE